MNSSRTSRYLRLQRQRRGKPITTKEEVYRSTDAKIDQDMPGFPHGTASEEMIRPEQGGDRKAADPELSDGHRDGGKATDEERLK